MECMECAQHNKHVKQYNVHHLELHHAILTAPHTTFVRSESPNTGNPKRGELD